MVSISKRIDAVNEIDFTYRAAVLPAPPSVKIELTSRCNFSCGFCAHRTGGKKNSDMNFEFYKRIVNEMRQEGVRELGLFYIGESMLCSWLPEAIEYAKKEVGFPYVFLTTNGSLATEDRLDKIMKAGLDSLKWSFNNADEWQFRQITGIAPSMYKTIIGNIKNAKKIRDDNGYSTKLYASSIKYDGEQLEKMQRAVDEIIPFVDEHYWLPLYSFGDVATENERKLGFKPLVGNVGRAENMRPPLPCWAVFKEGHITSDGLMSACCFDHSDNWIMADLKQVSFMEGWNSEAYQKLRQAHLSGDVHNTACEPCIHGKKQRCQHGEVVVEYQSDEVIPQTLIVRS